MTKSLIYSLIFHSIMILLTVLTLPFMIRQPIDLPPIVSVELIQISDKTINYGRVLEVMGTLSGAGFSKVALISEPYKN